MELLRSQFEYFGNPFYNDLGEKVITSPLGQIEDKIMNLAELLERECLADESQRHRAKYFQ